MTGLSTVTRPQPNAGVPAASLWAGRIMSGLAIVFFTFDGVMKFIQPQVVIDATRQIGWPPTRRRLRSLEQYCSPARRFMRFPGPRPSAQSSSRAIWAGAVAAHARLGDPLFTHILFGVYLGLFVWGGLWCRNPRIRALIPVGT